MLSVVHDVSRRIQAEELVQQQEEAQDREQATLLHISHRLASTLELKPDLILDQLWTIVQYSHAALFVVEDSSLVTVAMRGVEQPEGAAPISIRLDGPEALTGLFNEHRPIRIADVAAAQEQAQFLRSLLGNGARRLLDGVQAWMWVPLAVKGRILGGIGVAHAQRDYFTSHHADLALTVANQAAITMVNAQLYNDARALAVLEERQRLAREPPRCRQSVAVFRRSNRRGPAAPVGPGSGGGTALARGPAQADARRHGRNAGPACRAAPFHADRCGVG